VRDNPSSAAAMGVNVARARATAFAVSSGYAGLAGVMVVLWFGLLKADENEFEGSWSIAVAISLLAMVIIGGLGSVWGAVLGAMFVFGLPLALRLLVPSVPLLAKITEGSGGFTPPVITAFAYGALIVLVVIFEPGGLAAIGRRITARFSR
jgi:branched-chain amino acid transport system permease protein